MLLKALDSGLRRNDRGLVVEPVRARSNGGREYWQHGPIELVIDAWGDSTAVRNAFEAAWLRFQGILIELVDELHLLRMPASSHPNPKGRIARRMVAATSPFGMEFITPMAAVAGSVAEEVCEFFAAEPEIRRACVNNGGDIAMHLAAGENMVVGIVANAYTPSLDGGIALSSEMVVRGIATSGWRGRSFSLGIVDSVTVLARSASVADAAATMIANAVNAEHPAIVRAPAITRKDDSDLGTRMVTVDVGPLPAHVCEAALDAGWRAAEGYAARGLIHGAALALQGRWRVLGIDFRSTPSSVMLAA